MPSADYDKHKMKPVLGVFALTFARLAHAQDVLTVLGEQDGISQFTDILSQYTDLVDYLNTGVHVSLYEPTSVDREADPSRDIASTDRLCHCASQIVHAGCLC